MKLLLGNMAHTHTLMQLGKIIAHEEKNYNLSIKAMKTLVNHSYILFFSLHEKR